MKPCAKCGQAPRHKKLSYCQPCANEIWRGYKKGKSILQQEAAIKQPASFTRAQKLQLIAERHKAALARQAVKA